MSFWSAHDQPVIYRAPPAKCAKKCVLVNFFRFSKNREKSQKTQRKSGFLCHFLLIKTAFFLKRSSQKCIIKTIISYTTNAQLFLWKTVRKCLRTNVIHLFLKMFWNFLFWFRQAKVVWIFSNFFGRFFVQFFNLLIKIEEPLDVVKTYPKNCEFLFIRETLNFFISKTRNCFLSVALHKTCFKNCGFC